MKLKTNQDLKLAVIKLSQLYRTELIKSQEKYFKKFPMQHI